MFLRVVSRECLPHCRPLAHSRGVPAQSQVTGKARTADPGVRVGRRPLGRASHCIGRNSSRVPGAPPSTCANADRRTCVGTGVRTPHERSGSNGSDRPAAPAVGGANSVPGAGTGATVCAVVRKFGRFARGVRDMLALPPSAQAPVRFLYASCASARIPYRQRRTRTAHVSTTRIANRYGCERRKRQEFVEVRPRQRLA